MRVAAVALVLIAGAAVVLVFANTLNSWVLGGLVGGLAALLLSIPISLALFTWLARRHNAFLRVLDQSFENEPEFADDFLHEPVVYEADPFHEDEDLAVEPRYLLAERRLPASGSLHLPVVGRGLARYEEDQEPPFQQEPRNYPRQPRSSRHLQENTQTTHTPQRSARGETGYQSATHALSQYQLEALREARQEAQHQRSGADSPSRHQESRTQALQRARASRQLRTRSSAFGARRPLNEDEAWVNESEDEHGEEDFSQDQYSERYQYEPRPASYPRQPRSQRNRSAETWDEEEEYNEPPGRRSRFSPERPSSKMRRRTSHFYEDPFRED